MNKTNSVLVPVIKRRIDVLKSRDGELDLKAITQYAESIGYNFDAENAKAREIARFCRSVIATYRDKDGDRTILATGRSGEFIDRERCRDKGKLISAISSMTEMRDGLNRIINKTQRQVDGQLSFFTTMHAGAVTVGERG